MKRGVAKYEDLRGDENSLLATTGRAWVFGDHVARQQLLAEVYGDQHPSVAKAFALAALNPHFAGHAAAGDFIVAGLEFAADVTGRLVPATLKAVGIAAVIARSFGAAFARDAINMGLPVLVVEETAAIKNGDHLRVDIEAHIVANLSSGDRYVIRNLDDAIIAILRGEQGIS
jgi:3-isopropylmalate/(R)-2-methylmalate dehydratase small subunit